jgi:SAM-dependent methyltransferase
MNPRCPSQPSDNGIEWSALKAQRPNFDGLGYADYFPDRLKRKMLELARIKSSDVFYDLGCGDGSILIFAVKEFGVKKAVGFERNPVRRALVTKRVEREGLTNKISIEGEMFEADLNEADVMFSMIMEYENDFEDLFSRAPIGSRLVKHDLPLIGFDFDTVDFPFYLVRFPVRRLASPKEWAAKVMGRSNANVHQLWNELFYYQYEKGYTKWDIKRFDRILRCRFVQ